MAVDRNTGFVSWRGTLGSPSQNITNSRISSPLTFATNKTFALAMASYSTCNVLSHTVTWEEDLNPAIPGVKANVDMKGKVFFRDPDTLKTLSFLYPSPNLTDTVATPAGLRLLNSVVIAIVGLINTATGKSYEPLYGVVYQRS